jgi:hypothetical protein
MQPAKQAAVSAAAIGFEALQRVHRVTFIFYRFKSPYPLDIGNATAGQHEAG